MKKLTAGVIMICWSMIMYNIGRGCTLIKLEKLLKREQDEYDKWSKETRDFIKETEELTKRKQEKEEEAV